MTCDGSMEVVNIGEGAARSTDVMGWTGHIVREETDGVFDGGLGITIVDEWSVVQSMLRDPWRETLCGSVTRWVQQDLVRRRGCWVYMKGIG